MGYETFSKTTYERSRRSHGITSDMGVTRAAEQEAKKTGKLRPSVDPAVDAIRRSLVRFDARDGKWVVTVGCPMDIESICDTTGSMGDNVDVAMKVLPDTYALCAQMLPGYDPQLAIGIFGDVEDKFVLCRPQYEMSADKIVGALKDMTPERDGGDFTEDPQYGLFGAAYLTAAYTNRIGLKGYHFVISDAPTREYLRQSHIERVFGEDVWEKLTENGHQIDPKNLPTTKEVVGDLLKRAHAFFLQVGNDSSVKSQWAELYGRERVVTLPDTKYLPQVQAAIIGLTEGTLNSQEIKNFLMANNMPKSAAEDVLRDLIGIPIGAQSALRGRLPRAVPKAGDVFANKTDLWPIDHDAVPAVADTANDTVNWL